MTAINIGMRLQVSWREGDEIVNAIGLPLRLDEGPVLVLQSPDGSEVSIPWSDSLVVGVVRDP
jgi:hypothetical protein